MMVCWPVRLIAIAATLTTHGTEATFSIAATDSKTGWIGAAGASCDGANDVSVLQSLYHGVPGKGVLVTQGALPPSPEVTDVGTSLLLEETHPELIVLALTAPFAEDSGEAQTNGDQTFAKTSLRQYGIVDLKGRASGYTGESIKDYYHALGLTEAIYGTYTQNDMQGTLDSGDLGNFTYSIQGNIVVEGTLSRMEAAFQGLTDVGCDLADRLFRALTEVDVVSSDGRYGDARCTSAYNKPAHGAFLRVDDASGTTLVSIDVTGENEQSNPFDTLRTEYAAWRVNNPCPAVPTASPTAMPTTATLTETPTTVIPTETPTTVMPTETPATVIVPTTTPTTLTTTETPTTLAPTDSPTFLPSASPSSPPSPTPSPIVTPSNKYPACNVCGDGMEMLAPEQVIPDTNISCGAFRVEGNRGNLDETDCILLQELSLESCECVTSGAYKKTAFWFGVAIAFIGLFG